ncbi:hypothetical protein [Noviherbaspirillum sp.]|uniref:hypothetical protein n=1 Tax=Noviherbaspirillum sp. TaxID=1926288 RepID=UPI0025CC0EAC|nr:hypothetical protein [Noviherbaspirillum sp.]
MTKFLPGILVGAPFLVTSIFLADTQLHSQKELSRAIGVCRPYRCVKYKGSDDHYHYFQETGKFGALGPSNKFKISKDIISIQPSAVDRSMTYDQNNGLFKIIGIGKPEEVIKADFVEQYTREEENYLEAVKQLNGYSKSDASEHKLRAVRQAMMASYFANHLNEASTYAHALIDVVNDRSTSFFYRGGVDLYADNVYRANTVLGLVALKSGNVEQAKTHLIESAKVPGSAVLSTFGPNTVLARTLLLAGEKQAVIEYLTLCEKFWKVDTLRDWKSMIENGETPPFSQYLY